MALSDRKRRAYLSLPLPQNLYPKKLSVKDIRFLQKNGSKKSNRNNGILSVRIQKGVKVLYEKHVKKALTHKTPLYAQVWEKKRKAYGQCYIAKVAPAVAVLTAAPIHSTDSKSKQRAPLPIETQHTQGFFFNRNDSSLSARPPVHTKNNNVPPLPQEFFYQKKEKYGNLEPLPLKQNNLEFGSQACLDNFHNGKAFTENDGKTATEWVSQSRLFSTPLCIYVQAIKTVDNPLHITSHSIERHLTTVSKENPKVYQSFITKNALLSYARALQICKSFATPPLFANGKNKYLYCRYLYNVEHLKNGLHSQMSFQVHPLKGKVRAHERKKIALFYGQIAKKDMVRYSKNARVLPGLFFDNMYTLLESRVDVCIYRAGFSSTIAAARQEIRNGYLQRNGKSLGSCKIHNKPGDILSYKCGGRVPYHVQEKEKYHYKRVYTRTTRALYRLWYCMNCNTTAFSDTIFYKEKARRHLFEAHTRVRLKKWSKHQLQQYCSFAHVFVPGFFLYKNLCNPYLFYHANPQRLICRFFDKGTSKYFGDGFLQKKDVSFLYDFPAVNTPGKMHNFVDNDVHFSTLAFVGKQEVSWIIRKKAHEDFLGRSYTLKEEKQVFPCVSKTLDCTLCTPWGAQGAQSAHLIFFYNVCIAAFLKHNCRKRRFFTSTVGGEHVFKTFKKNIHNASTAPVWGQKPLHLEISQKTLTVIYLYRPQKIISPFYIDFDALQV